MTRRTDIAVIGAGMAGASLAAEIAGKRPVLMIEAEPRPGYHSTGRSAAFWAESYGGPSVQPLTTASGPFLAEPPPEFHERSFLSPRGALTVARPDSEPLLDAMRADFSSAGVRLDRLDRSGLERHVPGLRPDWTAGLLEPSCSDIDVAALHGAYLRAARRRGAELITDAAVSAIVSHSGTWMLQTRQGPVEAEIIVNAAGAWADEVALAAGVSPIGIQPYRRTIAQLRVAPSVPDDLPLVIDAEGLFYFKPETGGRLWLSPHDETRCEPCDCAADDLDVAVAIDRLEQVVDWRVERVEHRWAGLRSFAPDRLPVFGFAPDHDRFFWCAGQGGFGIQTAPAAARLCASLLLGTSPDPLLSAVDIPSYSPNRFPATVS